MDGPNLRYMFLADILSDGNANLFERWHAELCLSFAFFHG